MYKLWHVCGMIISTWTSFAHIFTMEKAVFKIIFGMKFYLGIMNHFIFRYSAFILQKHKISMLNFGVEYN